MSRGWRQQEQDPTLLVEGVSGMARRAGRLPRWVGGDRPSLLQRCSPRQKSWEKSTCGLLALHSSQRKPKRSPKHTRAAWPSSPDPSRSAAALRQKQRPARSPPLGFVSSKCGNGHDTAHVTRQARDRICASLLSRRRGVCLIACAALRVVFSLAGRSDCCFANESWLTVN